jgi:hypothetical protein
MQLDNVMGYLMHDMEMKGCIDTDFMVDSNF